MTKCRFGTRRVKMLMGAIEFPKKGAMKFKEPSTNWKLEVISAFCCRLIYHKELNLFHRNKVHFKKKN
jgi:hypothetical protein